jgi:hypothetical protein
MSPKVFSKSPHRTERATPELSKFVSSIGELSVVNK